MRAVRDEELTDRDSGELITLPVPRSDPPPDEAAPFTRVRETVRNAARRQLEAETREVERESIRDVVRESIPEPVRLPMQRSFGSPIALGLLLGAIAAVWLITMFGLDPPRARAALRAHFHALLHVRATDIRRSVPHGGWAIAPPRLWGRLPAASSSEPPAEGRHDYGF